MLTLRQPLALCRAAPTATAGRRGSSRLQCRAASPQRAAITATAASLPASPKRTPASPLNSLSASRLSAAMLEPPAPPRPTVTNINIVIAGSHQYLGRPELAGAAGGAGSAAPATPVDAHKAFLDDPDAWASVMQPLDVPGGSRQLIYKFQARAHAGCCTCALMHACVRACADAVQ